MPENQGENAGFVETAENGNPPAAVATEPPTLKAEPWFDDNGNPGFFLSAADPFTDFTLRRYMDCVKARAAKLVNPDDKAKLETHVDAVLELRNMLHQWADSHPELCVKV